MFRTYRAGIDSLFLLAFLGTGMLNKVLSLFLTPRTEAQNDRRLAILAHCKRHANNTTSSGK